MNLVKIISAFVVSFLLTACDSPQWQSNETLEKRPVHTAFVVDTDPSTEKDPDDRIVAFILQKIGAMPELVITTKGNVSAEKAYANAQALWGSRLVVRGQSACDSQMMQRLTHQLEQQPLTILALGPVTNTATLLRCRPDLRSRITQVIVVAGRESNEAFWLNERWKVGRPMRDLNYETNRLAMRQLLSSGVSVRLVPFAAGNAVRIHPGEVRNLPLAELERVRHWASTLVPIGGRGTIPAFDPVAAAFMLWPTEFDCQAIKAQAETDLVVTKTTRSNIRWCVPENPKRVHSLILSSLHRGNI